MATQKILTRDFVLCFFAQFTFSSVFYILIPTLPIYLSRLGAKEAEIGVLIGVFSVSSLIFRPIVGKALAKIPERSFMIAGALFFTSSSVAYLFAPPFWPLLAVRAFHGVGLAFFSTASFTLLANITPETIRGRIISYFYLSINFAFGFAPYFGMLLINRFDFPFNFKFLFLGCTGLSLCCLLITLKLGKIRRLPVEDPFSKKQSFLSLEALPPAIIASIITITWGAMTAFFPLYALRKGVDNPGLFFAAFAVTLILVRSLGGKILDVYPREKVILPCLFNLIISMPILAFSSTLPMFILVAIIWGVGSAFLYPCLLAYTLDRAGSARGPAMGTFTALTDLGAGMGAVMMGIILQLTSYPVMFLCLALTGIINFFYFYFAVRKKPQETPVPVRERVCPPEAAIVGRE
ncbi:MAG: MFS transporter [Thermodesulfobacteriota bacterium]|jgi:MFS family permease